MSPKLEKPYPAGLADHNAGGMRTRIDLVGGYGMSSNIAVWSLSLDCYCPICNEEVDLLAHPDFFEKNEIQVCEQGTTKTRGMKANCPICGYEIVVDCVV